MDGHEWTNVQAPIREMFLAMTRAIQDQSTDMTRILQRMDTFVTRDNSMKDMYTREEGQRLEAGKATVDVVRSLESRLDKSNMQVAKLAGVVEFQTTAITDLNCRLERALRQLAEHQEMIMHPNHEDIYEYMDKTDKDIRRDIHLTLLTKEDKVTDIDNSKNVAVVIRKLQEEFTQLDARVEQVSTVEVKSTDSMRALREEMLASHENLRSEVESIKSQTLAHTEQAVGVVKKFAKDLLISEMGDRGITGRLNMMEKTLSSVETQCNSTFNEIERDIDAKIRRYHDEKISKVLSSQLDAGTVKGIVEHILQERRFGDINGADLQRALVDHSAAMRVEATKEQHLLKRELQLQQTESLREWQARILDRVDGISVVTDTMRKESEAERQRMRELSEEIQMSLNKKANQSEVRAIVRGGKVGGVASSTESAVASTNTEALQAMQEKLHDLQVELGRVRKTAGMETSNIRLLLQEKLGQKQVESVVASAMSRSGSGPGAEGLDLRRYNIQGTFKSSHQSSPDWKLAVGELGLALRQGLASKLSRDECRALLVDEMQDLSNSVSRLSREVENKAEQHEYARVMHSLDTLNSRVVGELTGGLWIWTSRQLVSGDGGAGASDNRIPWDAQVVNAAPSSLLWRKGSTEITVKLPGLYRIGLAVFTNVPVSLTVCLNGEPVLVLGPDTTPDRLSSFANSQGLREERYLLRRLRHSAGETTAVSLDEPLSLPANAVISVAYQSAIASQAYLSLRKL